MKAVKDEVRPHIRALGFETDRRPKGERPWHWRSGSLFRRREAYVDELIIQWERYDRPNFIFNFSTSQKERMDVALRYHPSPASDGLARIYPAKLWLGLTLRSTWFGREKTVAETVRVARERLSDLDQFLRTGAPATHLDWRRGCFKG